MSAHSENCRVTKEIPTNKFTKIPWLSDVGRARFNLDCVRGVHLPQADVLAAWLNQLL
jgi:hypothetical protein